MYKRALISVYDKTGLEELLQPLVKQGLHLVSTGGTAEFLKSKAFKVQEVRELTAFPEILSGRVKTLHPSIFAPLLAREWEEEDQNVLKKYNMTAFDLLIVNLYPFEEKAKNLENKKKVEWIDIGGPSLLRAGAKNYFSVMTVCDPNDYAVIQKQNDLFLRKEMAVKVFKKIALYNEQIAASLNSQNHSSQKSDSFKERASKELFIKADFFKSLRYGENPHQKAQWFTSGQKGLHEAKIIQGKELSYNNILDFDNAVQALNEFEEPCVVAVKHNNPCGIGTDSKISLALQKALTADPLSVFGALLAFNKRVDQDCAKQLMNLFLEGLIAPSYSQSALEILKKRKNLRLLELPNIHSDFLSDSIREVRGGFLLQSRQKSLKGFQETWKIHGAAPPQNVKKDILFAWKLCAHLKSNAIALVKNQQTLGLGMGQVNRVDAVKLAVQRLKQFHPQQKEDLVLASDGFFPFADSIPLAHQAGVRWIIQPGGSIRDNEVLQKSRSLNLNMILTGQRLFKH